MLEEVVLSSDSSSLSSTTFLISPEVGCATDNLSYTTLTSTSSPTLLQDGSLLSSRPLPPSTAGKRTKVTTSFVTGEGTRTAVDLDRLNADGSIVGITVRDLRLSSSPTLESLTVHGLDAGTMNSLLGPDLAVSKLAKLRQPLLRHLTAHAWSRFYLTPDPLPVPGVFTYTQSDYETSLRLPGSLVVTSTSTSLTVEHLSVVVGEDGGRVFGKTVVVREIDEKGRVGKVSNWKEERKERAKAV